ncbi:MAG: hypothetical protein KDK23_15995 [Leptospiraceae bacterium]|nr:hypothetical protein [Leptospiraceae bacterium]
MTKYTTLSVAILLCILANGCLPGKDELSKESKRELIQGYWNLQRDKQPYGEIKGKKKKPDLDVTEDRWIYLGSGKSCDYSWLTSEKIRVKCDRTYPASFSEFPHLTKEEMHVQSTYHDGEVTFVKYVRFHEEKRYF